MRNVWLRSGCGRKARKASVARPFSRINRSMLNPALDLAELAQAYKAKNRIQIRDVLQTAPAEDL